ncbi:MAG TPA: alpha-amylase family glycosyl hydrolase [Caulobacteraceae bacterium]
MTDAATKPEWWRTGVVYQVYPRSFQDSDGDGVGDLRGIEQRLDYLVWLGVDAIWISPFQPSPMKDFGYDVSDYCGVDPLFGTLDDFDRLLAAAHAKGLRVLIDFVPNHTSDQHPWFLESRANRDNPKRDWYIWRDPEPGWEPPNNWLSVFGGGAWRFDPHTQQFYLHSFLPQQPDLNWRNPEVERAMFDVLRFWLDRGVDGFRMDVLWYLVKDEKFRDNPHNPAFDPARDPPHLTLDPVYSSDRPETLDIVKRMRALLDSYPGDRVMVAETYLPIARLAAWYGDKLDAAHMPFNFKLIQTAWNAQAVADVVTRYEAALPDGAQPNWVLGNHDNPRVASRLGARRARAAAVLLLTLRGTPTLYYGDELGMTDAPISPDAVRDPREQTQPGHGRDPERTPMRWTGAAKARFTTGEPWLPIGVDAAHVNVETERADADSMLSLHHRLLALRRAAPALHRGSMRVLEVEGAVFAYAREADGHRFIVAVNFAAEPQGFSAPDIAGGTIILSTAADREGQPVSGSLDLGPDEAVVIQT